MKGIININDIHKSGSENRPLTHKVVHNKQEGTNGIIRNTRNLTLINLYHCFSLEIRIV